LITKGWFGICECRLEFAGLVIIRLVSSPGARGSLIILPKFLCRIPDICRHYLKLDRFKVLQVSIRVECPGIDAIMSPFHNVESNNCWKIKTKVIVCRKKQIMLSPPGSNLHVRVRILERHITLSCLMPLYTLNFELFRKL